MLRGMFGTKRNEVTGELRKLHNEERHSLNLLPDIIRMIRSRRVRWVGLLPRMGEMRDAYKVLVGKPGWKRPLGRRGQEDNIKMNLREI
jgi:hypothetical protein